jgi:hypothetical protein
MLASYLGRIRPLSLNLALLLLANENAWIGLSEENLKGRERVAEHQSSSEHPTASTELDLGQYFTADFNSVPLPILTFLIRCP